jgi:hypothetical protein
MPKKMEAALKREATKRGYTGRRAAAFVYGTMRNRGWTPEVKHHVKWKRIKKKK